MQQNTTIEPIAPATSTDMLTEILRGSARKLLAAALESEVTGFLAKFETARDDAGRKLVVRNGHKPERTVLTGLGPVAVVAPRVEDRRPEDGREKFESAILPPYLRRAKTVDELIPWLYLKGVSTGDFPEALKALFGGEAKSLSANTVQRLKEVWARELDEWNGRSLEGKRYVYMWADGVHFNVRLGEKDHICLLVVLGVTALGKKELVGLQMGFGESELSWLELLNDLKRRGLKNGPDLAIGDGALGFWAALPKVFSKCRVQRCWVHKTANVLNCLPDKIHATAKHALQQIWMAETRAEAVKALESFSATYKAKHPKAVECLEKDRDSLLAFYDFPAEHWRHIRTTNPIESVFATVRLRTKKTKGCGTADAAVTMAFKLVQSAEKNWNRLTGSELLAKVEMGVEFKDGLEAVA